jgi:hypothetical protein
LGLLEGSWADAHDQGTGCGPRFGEWPGVCVMEGRALSVLLEVGGLDTLGKFLEVSGKEAGRGMRF